MAAAASSSKYSAIFLILTLLLSTTLSTASGSCNPSPKAPPKPPSPSPSKPPPSPPAKKATCPKDTLKLGACADLLGGVVHIVVGSPPYSKCCTVLEGLADLEAAVCLCTAIKANILGINLNVPVALSLLVTTCGRSLPPGYQCK